MNAERAQSETAHVRLPRPLVEKINQKVGVEYLSFGEAVRSLLRKGLATTEEAK